MQYMNKRMFIFSQNIVIFLFIGCTILCLIIIDSYSYLYKIWKEIYLFMYDVDGLISRYLF